MLNRKNAFQVSKWILSLLFITQPAWAQKNEWANVFGGTAYETVNDIAIDNAGNIYATGYFSGSADFDPGPNIQSLTANGNSDIFVIKLDAAGNFIWVQQFGGNSNVTTHDVGNAIAVDQAGDIVVCGSFKGVVDFDPSAATYSMGGTINGVSSSDIFILKLNANGDFVWAHWMGGMNDDDAGKSLSIDNTGNIYMTGLASDSIDFNPAAGIAFLNSNIYWQQYVFTCKFNSAGTFSWVTKTVNPLLGPTTGEIVNVSTVFSSGTLRIAGTFKGNIDLDPGPGSQQYSGPDSLNNYVFVSLLTAANGVLQLGTVFIGPGSAEAYSIASYPSGTIFITGAFNGTIDFDQGGSGGNMSAAPNLYSELFLVRMAPTGVFSMAKQIGGTANSNGYCAGKAVSVDNAGNIFLAGSFRDTIDFDPNGGIYHLVCSLNDNGFVAKLDPTGNFVWAAEFGDGSFPNILNTQCMGVDQAGDIILGGDFAATDADFYPPTQRYRSSIGSRDCFITKYSPCQVSTSTISATACGSYTSQGSGTTWTSSGTYYDVIQNSSGCDSIMTLNLTILSSTPPVITAAGATTFCVGDSVVLSATPGMSAYQWYRRNYAIPGATSMNYTAKARGRYKCITQQNTICVDTSNIIFVQVPCTPIGPNQPRLFEEEQDQPQPLIMVPNPGNGLFSMKSSAGLLQIYDSMGREVLSQEIAADENILDLSGHPDGIYFIRLKSGGTVQRVKLLLVR